jgi:hypothetical protein
MPTLRHPASRRFAAVGVLLLLPITLAACPSTGPATGNTMHMSLVDVSDNQIGGGPLGATGNSTDQLVGDLAEGGPGTWRGVVNGSTDTTIKTTVMTEECETHIVGTQQIEVTGVQGTFGDSNFKLVFLPKAPPNYTSSDTCNPQSPQKASNGIEWLNFSNGAYDDDGGMFVTLPGRPGGSWQTGLGKGEENDPCTFLAPLLGCTWTRTFTVEYHDAT